MAFLIYDCVGIERLQIVNTSGLFFFLPFVSVRFLFLLFWGFVLQHTHTHKYLHKKDSTRIGWMNMLGCRTQTDRGRVSHTNIYGSIISTKWNGMMKMTNEYLIWSECRFDDEDTAKEESKRFTITRNSTGKLANLIYDFVFLHPLKLFLRLLKPCNNVNIYQTNDAFAGRFTQSTVSE